MKPKEIQKLIELVEKSSVNELEVSRWGKKVCIRKNIQNNSNHGTVIAAQAPVVMQATPVQAPQIAEEKIVEKPKKEINDNLLEIRSPMVGTFYRSPSPKANSYVNDGDKVTNGQVLCIIEAMKLMNEIEAEYPCKIVEILAEDSQPVEYDQVLFKVEKV